MGFCLEDIVWGAYDPVTGERGLIQAEQGKSTPVQDPKCDHVDVFLIWRKVLVHVQ